MVAQGHVKNPVLKLRIPDAREHQQAMDAELRLALLQAKDARQALSDAARRWRQLDDRKDLKLRQVEYRLSLGLGRID
jgi:hypothetical protein